MAQLRVISTWIVARLDIRSERGATGVEYGLFVGFIAAAIIMAVFFLGDETRKNLQCPTTRSC